MRSQERKNQIWEEIRQKGKKHYLQGRVKSGLLIGAAITFLRAGFDGQLTFEYIFHPDFLLSLVSALVTFPLFFYLMGIWLWNRNEKQYAQEDHE